MIVLLDTTVFSADPLCAKAAWKVLALSAPGWGIRVAVTDVVVAEAVANYCRDVGTLQTGLEAWTERKRFGDYGLEEASSAAKDILSAKIGLYESHLKENLETSSVEILPVAQIPHMELVARATARRRPCDDNGDGYRDTLNWLTVLNVARENPDERIIWVSFNSKDFGASEDSSGTVLHPHLAEDLNEIAAGERVSWKHTLAEAVLAVAEEFSPGEQQDIEKVHEKAREASVLSFLVGEVLTSALDYPIDPRRCALPIETESAKFRSLDGIRNLNLFVRGVGAFGTAAEFTVEVDAGIDAVLVFSDPAPGTESVTSNRYINKPILLRGLITLGKKFENPIGAQLAEVESLPGDPDRKLWETGHRANQSSLERHAMLRARANVAHEAALSAIVNTQAFREASEAAASVYESSEAFREARKAALCAIENNVGMRRASETALSAIVNTQAMREAREAALSAFERSEAFRGAQEAALSAFESSEAFREARELALSAIEITAAMREAREAALSALEGYQGTDGSGAEEAGAADDGPDQDLADG